MITLTAMVSASSNTRSITKRTLHTLLACVVFLSGCSTMAETDTAVAKPRNVPAAAIEIAFFDISDYNARKVELERLARVFAGDATLRNAFSCAREADELRCVSLDQGKAGRCEPLYETSYRPAGTLTLRKTYLAINVVADDAAGCFTGRKTFAELRDLLREALVGEFGRGRVRTHDLSLGDVHIDRDSGKIRF